VISVIKHFLPLPIIHKALISPISLEPAYMFGCLKKSGNFGGFYASAAIESFKEKQSQLLLDKRCSCQTIIQTNQYFRRIT
jgi:hypothetical protein